MHMHTHTKSLFLHYVKNYARRFSSQLYSTVPLFVLVQPVTCCRKACIRLILARLWMTCNFICWASTPCLLHTSVVFESHWETGMRLCEHCVQHAALYVSSTCACYAYHHSSYYREACDNSDVILEVLPTAGSPVALSSGVLSSVPAKKVRLDEDDDSSSVYGSSLHSSPTASPAPIDRSALKRQSTSNQKNKQVLNNFYHFPHVSASNRAWYLCIIKWCFSHRTRVS